jgi:hypothetical protein
MLKTSLYKGKWHYDNLEYIKRPLEIIVFPFYAVLFLVVLFFFFCLMMVLSIRTGL